MLGLIWHYYHNFNMISCYWSRWHIYYSWNQENTQLSYFWFLAFIRLQTFSFSAVGSFVIFLKVGVLFVFGNIGVANGLPVDIKGWSAIIDLDPRYHVWRQAEVRVLLGLGVWLVVLEVLCVGPVHCVEHGDDEAISDDNVVYICIKKLYEPSSFTLNFLTLFCQSCIQYFTTWCSWLFGQVTQKVWYCFLT